MRAGFESGDACIDWAGAAMASPELGPLPDVLALVVSGDLDTNTPSLAGRQAAAQFPHATWVDVPNRTREARPGARPHFVRALSVPSGG